MKITEVRVRPRLDPEGRVKAFASITLDNQIVIHQLRVIEGDNGLFVAMPNQRQADGGYRDIAHPVNAETRAMLTDAVLTAYAESVRPAYA